jgi:hypothetical protein
LRNATISAGIKMDSKEIGREDVKYPYWQRKKCNYLFLIIIVIIPVS